MRWTLLFRGLLVCTPVLAAVLFTVQNLSRTTTLSFDVYFMAWALSRPIPVPWIVWSSFAIGALGTYVFTALRTRKLRQTVTRLEQEALLRAAGRAEPRLDPPVDDWGR